MGIVKDPDQKTKKGRTNPRKPREVHEYEAEIMQEFAAAGSLFVAMFAAEAACAQKQGGILKMYSPDSPASMSIHEEATVFAEGPMMGVFNNLVMFDQHVPQNSLQSIVPDLATGWSWNEDGTELTLPLRQGVSWHDGKPFTAKDVVCTFDLLTGKSSEKLRVNPRKSWYRNLERGHHERRLRGHLPSEAAAAGLFTLLASGYRRSIPATCRRATCASHPIGTGPFKFVEFKPNEYIKVTRNPDYWKRAGLISTASSIRSSTTCRRRSWRLSPASST